MTRRTTLVSRKLATLVLQGLPEDVSEERVTGHTRQAWKFHQALKDLCKSDLEQVDLPMIRYLFRGGRVQPNFPRFGVRDFRRITGRVKVRFADSSNNPHLNAATLWTERGGDRIEVAAGPKYSLKEQQRALLYMVVSLHFGLDGLGAGNRFEDRVKEEVDSFYSVNSDVVEEVFNKFREAK